MISIGNEVRVPMLNGGQRSRRSQCKWTQRGLLLVAVSLFAGPFAILRGVSDFADDPYVEPLSAKQEDMDIEDKMDIEDAFELIFTNVYISVQP
ncbi:hypothetical protein QR680_014705 [Steinernema hermaphroditum]|uniref:Uncharacterized protein n=1 Tax=Steinernema hermaphroditum TaxID=289476 RepID=A0AA39IBH0_9BILA|nr:hypothetical protein QR680_014705 [Steinernema hermaphroditum]